MMGLQIRVAILRLLRAYDDGQLHVDEGTLGELKEIGAAFAVLRRATAGQLLKPLRPKPKSVEEVDDEEVIARG